MKHFFSRLILLLKGISILRDIWDQRWRNIMLIKTTYPNFTVVISFVFGLGIINEFEHTIQEMSKLEM